MIFLACLAVSFCKEGPYIPPAPTGIARVIQPLDHTGAFPGTFVQKVLLYEQFWREPSNRPARQRPIIVTMGGEAGVRGGYDHNGELFEWGRRMGALLVFPEHRYYGESIPESAKEQTPLSMRFLTVEQSLADHAQIIRQLRQNFTTDQAPLIVAGGSYPGMLAAWFRGTYPELADAAWASSAPLNNDEALQYKFFEVASRDFEDGNGQCGNIIRKAVQQIDEAFDKRDMSLLDGLGLCASHRSPDRDVLHLWVQNGWATLGMENYPYPIPPEFPAAFPAQKACEDTRMAVVTGQGVMGGLRAALQMVYNATQSLSCFDLSTEFFPCSDITGCGLGYNAKSWDYQSCTQLQQRIGSNGKTDLFSPRPYDAASIDKYCQKTWKIVPDRGFLGRFVDFSNATRILFPNGYYDPWYPYGFLASPNPGHIVTLQMEHSAHHLDLRGSDPSDPNSVVQARRLAEKIFTHWMDEALFARTGDHFAPY